MDSVPFFVGQLKAEFDRRLEKNARYSMRAFARDLAVSPSHLLRVLRGEKQLSLSSAHEWVARLGWVGPKAHRFVSSVSDQGTDLKKKREENPLLTSRAISPEEFERISEWQHLAILELTEIEGFYLEPISISRTLGITLEAASQALDRLVALDLLRKHETRGYRKMSSWIHTTGRERSSTALRLHQKSLLMKSVENLDKVPIEERANFGSLYAIDPNQIGEAKELINQFIVDLEKLLAGKKRTRVYAAGIFLTPLSTNLPKTKK